VCVSCMETKIIPELLSANLASKHSRDFDPY
jgi:hypothetical protein